MMKWIETLIKLGSSTTEFLRNVEEMEEEWIRRNEECFRFLDHMIDEANDQGQFFLSVLDNMMDNPSRPLVTVEIEMDDSFQEFREGKQELKPKLK